MLRPLPIVVALVMVGCTGKGPPEETPPPDDEEVGPLPEIDEEYPTLEPGVLLVMLWDPGNSGAGIRERMIIHRDGAVRYIADRRGSEQVFKKQLRAQLVEDLRFTLESEQFAKVDGSYPAGPSIHDGSHDRMIVATATGSRRIRYYVRSTELPLELRQVITGVEEAHAMFAAENPWNDER